VCVAPSSWLLTLHVHVRACQQVLVSSISSGDAGSLIACLPALHCPPCVPGVQVLLGDIFSDLPEVDNFELHERQCYREGPGRLTQVRWVGLPLWGWVLSWGLGWAWLARQQWLAGKGGGNNHRASWSSAAAVACAG
jgi:hypothetical protein